MKFFVTGASGQLGFALVKRLLADGHEVIAYLRHSSNDQLLKELPITIGRGSLLDRLGLKKWMKGCDGVFHVAGLIAWAGRDRKVLYRSNVDGSKTVLQVAKELRVPRVVVTSSVFGIGVPNRQDPIDETFSYTGNGIDYALSKHLAETFAVAVADDGFAVVVVNPGVILGPESRMLYALRHGRMPFHLPGGSAFVSLDDVVEGHLLAFTRGRSGQRYILGGDNLSYSAAITQACRYFGTPLPSYTLPASLLKWGAWVREYGARLIRHAPPRIPYQLAKAISGHQYYSSKKAQEELGWHFRPFAEILKTAFPS